MLLAGTPVAFSGTINETGDSVRTEASANPAVVTGTVIDESGEPVIGANISLKGSNDIIAVSDSNGLFSIPGLNGDETLKVEYLGYDDETIKLTNGEQSYRVVLKPDMSQLDEVVVVGYATQKKVDLTGAVSSISSNALSDRPLTNATSALAGLAAGLTVTNSGGNTPGYESQSILVRGQGTLNNAAPLVVVDGMTGIAISDINPQDIESISILKDAASAAIYGSRAANGVILVTTRQGAERALRVTYSGNVSFETVAKRLNLVTDYADFMEIQNAGLIANGQAPRFSQGKIDEWRNDGGKNPTVYPNTDWQDHIYRNPSVVQNHNLSITGGSRRVRYNITLGYVNNPGMIYYTDYQRYQLRSNLEVKIKPWLSVGTNIFGYIDKNNPVVGKRSGRRRRDIRFGSVQHRAGNDTLRPRHRTIWRCTKPGGRKCKQLQPLPSPMVLRHQIPDKDQEVGNQAERTPHPCQGTDNTRVICLQLLGAQHRASPDRPQPVSFHSRRSRIAS